MLLLPVASFKSLRMHSESQEANNQVPIVTVHGGRYLLLRGVSEL